ncbi:MAG: DUF5805 domain-containing protein [Halodesulfurarchaeum sp.]
MPDREPDTERVTVTTYVPAYQKRTWKQHADTLDMSLSEFVRSMVQAGRRGFGSSSGLAENSEGTEVPSHDNRLDGDPRDGNPGGNLRKTVLQTLDEEGPLTWEELLEEIVEEWEETLESTLQELDDENKIRRPVSGNTFELVEEPGNPR